MKNELNKDIKEKEEFKNLNSKYIKENLNEYEQLIIVAVNDWHATMFNNIIGNVENVNPNKCVNDKGTTFLHWIAGKKDVGFSKNNILQSLIDSGANPLLKDCDGLLASDIAKNKNNNTNYQLLLKAENSYKDFLDRRSKNSIFQTFKISEDGVIEKNSIDLTGLDMYESKLKMLKHRKI